MSFNEELSYDFYLENREPEEIPLIGYNCNEETFKKLKDFMEANYDFIIKYERNQSNLNSINYELRYKSLQDVSFMEFLRIKWNKLWQRKQIIT